MSAEPVSATEPAGGQPRVEVRSSGSRDEQFAAFVKSEIVKYARIVKASGAKVD